MLVLTTCNFSALFVDAVKFIGGHRNVPPGLYNEKRVRERPIPNLNQLNVSSEYDDASDDEIFGADGNDESRESVGEEVEIEQVLLPNQSESANEEHTEADPLERSNGSGGQQSGNESIPNVSSLNVASANIGSNENQDPSHTEAEQSNVNEMSIQNNSFNESDDFPGGPQNNEEYQTDNESILNDSALNGLDGSLVSSHVHTDDIEPTETATSYNKEVVPTASTSSDMGKSSQTQSCNSVKSESVVLLFEPCSANNVALNNLLDEEDEVIDEYDEDVTIILSRKTGFAKPFNTNNDGLVKRENDTVSGNLPFNETVSKLHFIFQNVITCGKELRYTILKKREILFWKY